MQYRYENFKDPIQKITGDAYRALYGFKVNYYFNKSPGRPPRRDKKILDIELADAEYTEKYLYNYLKNKSNGAWVKITRKEMNKNTQGNPHRITIALNWLLDRGYVSRHKINYGGYEYYCV